MGLDNKPNHTCIDVFKWINYNPKYLLTPSNVNHKSLFMKGKMKALDNIDDFKNKLC